MRAIVYTRQSIDKAEGIDRQKARCLALASSRGWDVLEVLEDNATSATKTRGKGSAWDRLLRSDADVVVAVNMDRLLRGQADLLKLVDSGLLVATVEGDLDLTTAEGKFRAELLTSLASFETRRKGERQVRANESRATNGMPVPGKRRYGYKPGNVEAHPEEAPVVAAMFQRVLDGESIFSIAKSLGWRTRRVRETLTNRSYAGYVTRKGEWFTADPRVARLVDEKTWTDVQTLLADPSRKTSPGNQIRFLASGIARCGVCEARMVHQSGNYRCKDHLSHPTIKAAMLDEALKWDAFTLVASQEAQGGEILTLAAELAELVRKREVQQDMATWPGANLASIRKEVARLGTEIERVESQLAALRSSLIAEDVAQALRSEMTDEEGADWWEAKWKELPLESKRQLLAGLHIRVFNGRGLDRVEVTRRTQGDSSPRTPQSTSS
ncbi:recombinase family protein [Microbacterium kunmingense]|uniref:recombinase family protein n=1 Tax=Microbacterium kunmingense TaxID=2915939 RepID=UPI002004A11E|nr:recombinase family protein [Microbacterium kunmingense]